MKREHLLRTRPVIKAATDWGFNFTLIAAALCCPLGSESAAQTLTILHNFAAASVDGKLPQTALLASGNTLYGAALAGGPSGYGCIYKLNTDGSGFTNLYICSSNSGFTAAATLIVSGQKLYGTMVNGGNLYGVVFALNTDGTGYTNLYVFNGDDGAEPYCYSGLTLSSNILYGTTVSGGSFGAGTVFALKTDGTTFTCLYHFTGTTDGNGPFGGLVLSGNTLYGTTTGGGNFGFGSVYSIHTDGTGFTNLHHFTGGSDGAGTYAGLILQNNVLYGTAGGGGNAPGDGTLFSLRIDGTAFNLLHTFSGGIDGGYPGSPLAIFGNTLYGYTSSGGVSNLGGIYSINSDGTGFKNLYAFKDATGAWPSSLVLSGTALYGTTPTGGTSGNGTIFSFPLGSSSVPQLSASAAPEGLVLSWPSSAGLILESTADLGPSAAWIAVPFTTNVSGQNITTNPFAGTQRFFRLSQ